MHCVFLVGLAALAACHRSGSPRREVGDSAPGTEPEVEQGTTTDHFDTTSGTDDIVVSLRLARKANPGEEFAQVKATWGHSHVPTELRPPTSQWWELDTCRLEQDRSSDPEDDYPPAALEPERTHPNEGRPDGYTIIFDGEVLDRPRIPTAVPWSEGVSVGVSATRVPDVADFTVDPLLWLDPPLDPTVAEGADGSLALAWTPGAPATIPGPRVIEGERMVILSLWVVSDGERLDCVLTDDGAFALNPIGAEVVRRLGRLSFTRTTVVYLDLGDAWVQGLTSDEVLVPAP